MLKRHQKNSRCRMPGLQPDGHPSIDSMETAPQALTWSPPGSTHTHEYLTPMPPSPIQGASTQRALPTIVERSPSPDYGSPLGLPNTTDPDVKEEDDPWDYVPKFV